MRTHSHASFYRTALVLVAIGLGPPSVHAQEPGNGPNLSPEQRFRRLDRNQDGVLTREEIPESPWVPSTPVRTYTVLLVHWSVCTFILAL